MLSKEALWRTLYRERLVDSKINATNILEQDSLDPTRMSWKRWLATLTGTQKTVSFPSSPIHLSHCTRPTVPSGLSSPHHDSGRNE